MKAERQALQPIAQRRVHLRSDNFPPLSERDVRVVRDYQACVGTLMYLSVFTRSDIAFGVVQV